ncbi:MAG: hypothetical protein K2K51_04345, partial [Bacteroidales bacterium]|nr:hypothetical protein [Bacteroidales bacterium]
LANNPAVGTDPPALVELGVNTLAKPVFRLDVAVKPGFALRIDDTGKWMNNQTIQKITNEITTYETWHELSPKSSSR